MGRIGSGVEVRERSIRLSFVFEGVAVRRTLKLNGQPLAPTPANIKHAQRLAAEIRGKIKHGVFAMIDYFPDDDQVEVQALTVGIQMDRWLKTLRMEESTLAGYGSAIKFWKNVQRAPDSTQPLGTVILRSLRLSHILLALATRPDLNGKTVNNYVSVLRAALQLAVDDKLLKDNPAEKVPRAAWQREPPDPFSRDELEAICKDMRQHYPEQVWNLVEWWGFSGPRPSEAVALKWENVDLARGEMQIREAIVRGVEKETTKTNVIRTVKLNSRAKAALERQHKHTYSAAGYVWLDPRYDEPWRDERAFRRSYWTPSLKRLGIRYRSQRNLRHTCATMLLMAQRTPAWCAAQLGHSVEMFLRIYSKWIETDQAEREVSAFEDWLSSTGGAGSDPSATRG